VRICGLGVRGEFSFFFFFFLFFSLSYLFDSCLLLVPSPTLIQIMIPELQGHYFTIHHHRRQHRLSSVICRHSRGSLGWVYHFLKYQVSPSLVLALALLSLNPIHHPLTIPSIPFAPSHSVSLRSTAQPLTTSRLDLTAPTAYQGPRKLLKEGQVTKAKSGRKLQMVLCNDIIVLVESRNLYRMVCLSVLLLLLLLLFLFQPRKYACPYLFSSSFGIDILLSFVVRVLD
jgi:hypothetical protein